MSNQLGQKTVIKFRTRFSLVIFHNISRWVVQIYKSYQYSVAWIVFILPEYVIKSKYYKKGKNCFFGFYIVTDIKLRKKRKIFFLLMCIRRRVLQRKSYFFIFSIALRNKLFIKCFEDSRRYFSFAFGSSKRL